MTDNRAVRFPAHRGTPDPAETAQPRGVCYGAHCAGRLRVAAHRSAEIPFHYDQRVLVRDGHIVVRPEYLIGQTAGARS